MMNKDEAVQKLSKVARISIAHAEDLYDSFFPKPVVPQYVADWYEGNKDEFEIALFQTIHDVSDGLTVDLTIEFRRWLVSVDIDALTILVNMHQFGYEVEKEPRYTVRIKGVDGYATHLNENLDNHEWFFASEDDEIKGYRIKHTRKELEANGFGWVFSCEGVEVKEVE